MKRKDIDLFLIELDRFIDKYGGYLESDLIPLFIAIFKANIDNGKNLSPSNQKYELNIPNLVKYINSFSTTKKKNRIIRTQFFVRKVAYGLKYKIVKDFSYEDIFFKMVFDTDNQLLKPQQVIENHNKDISSLKTFLIPEDWYHNNNIYLYNFKDYEATKL